MATIRILLGIFCIIALGSSRHPERNYLRRYANNETDQRIVAAARKEIGTREGDVPNTGPKVSQYLRYVGIKTPAPWCAAFVSYVFKQAGYPAPRTAWSPDLFPAKRLVGEARPGVVFGIYFSSLKRIAHCGIVEDVKGSWVFSVEGNTNTDGSREGNGVHRRVRHVRSIYRFANWSATNLPKL